MENTSCPCKKEKCIRLGDCEECRKHHIESKRQRPVACERNHKSLRQSTVMIEAVLWMVILQFVREFSKRLLNPLFPGTVFAERMITMLVMLVLSGAVVLYARIRKSALSVFPKHFQKNLYHCKLRFSDFADQYAPELYRWISGNYAIDIRQYRYACF